MFDKTIRHSRWGMPKLYAKTRLIPFPHFSVTLCCSSVPHLFVTCFVRWTASPGEYRRLDDHWLSVDQRLGQSFTPRGVAVGAISEWVVVASWDNVMVAWGHSDNVGAPHRPVMCGSAQVPSGQRSPLICDWKCKNSYNVHHPLTPVCGQPLSQADPLWLMIWQIITGFWTDIQSYASFHCV